MDNSRVGKGVAYSEAGRRKKIVKKIAQAITVNWPQAVKGSASFINGSAEGIEENVFVSAKDEADYKSKIRTWMSSLDTSSMVPRRKPSTTSCNIREAASSSGANERVANVDRQEVLYQKVQMLRSDLLPILSEIYRCFIFQLPNIKQTEIETLQKTKKVLDEIFTCLNVTKSQIGPDFESELEEKTRHIGSFVRLHRDYLEKKGQHSTDKCSTQQISHLPEQIPNENKMNPQVKSVESEQDDPEKLMQQVAKEYDVSLKHEIPLSAVTSTQPAPAFQRLVEVEKRTLLEEIKEVKMLLFDTKVVFNEADIIPSVAARASELIVELCFTGVTVSSDLKSHLISNQMSIKPLRLRIPTNYPNSSPILLDDLPPESRDEPTDLSTKAKQKLQRFLRSLDDPLSFKSIAMTWEKCVREALCDYAHKFGGGTFSSKYGGWKNV